MKNAQLIILSENSVYSPGVFVREVQKMGDPDTSCPVELIEFSLEPSTRSVPHSHPSTEIWQIASGRGRVITQDGELAVKAGDLVFLRPNETHQLENSSDEIMNALSISWIER